jgi:hypothetical protein
MGLAGAVRMRKLKRVPEQREVTRGVRNDATFCRKLAGNDIAVSLFSNASR